MLDINSIETTGKNTYYAINTPELEINVIGYYDSNSDYESFELNNVIDTNTGNEVEISETEFQQIVETIGHKKQTGELY